MRKGSKSSKETKEKISRANTGRKRTPEQRKKMSERCKRTWAQPGFREKMSEARKGKKRSPQARANIAAANRTPEKREASRKNMLANPPMASPEVRAKVSAALTGRKRPELSALMRSWGENHPSKRPEFRSFMSKNNPSKRPEVAAKISATKLALGDAHPSKRPEFRAIMSKHMLAMGDNHPMRRPEVVKKVAEKATGRKWSDESRKKQSRIQGSFEVQMKKRKTWLSNGNMSAGQKMLYQILLSLLVPFVPECCFSTSKTWAFCDAYLPLQKLDIEYDGHSHHRTPEGKAKDTKRDTDLLSLHDIRTLRIGRKEVFTDQALARIAAAVGGR